MRKILSFVTSLALVVGLLAVSAVPVAAASYTTCGDIFSLNSYTSGENFATGTEISGVQATMDVNNTFLHLCTPGTILGMDAAGTVLSIDNGNALVTMGFIKCDHEEGAFPASLCDGQLRLYTEQFTGYPLPTHVVFNEGLIDPNPKDFRINLVGDLVVFWYRQNANYSWVELNRVDMGGRLHEDDPNNVAKVYGETHDSGDGLGNNVAGERATVKDLKWRDSVNDWRSASFGSSCDWVDDQHACQVSSSGVMYLYTVN